MRGSFDPVHTNGSEHGCHNLEDLPSPTLSSPPKLLRKLTRLDGIAIIVGIIIGSGIFASVGLTLERSGSVGAAICAWFLSGLLVMLNSQVYCELGTMIPTTGGDYDYLQRAYGSQAAFSFAFFNFFISKTGSQAIIATIFGRYFSAAIYSMNETFRDQELNGESITTKLAAVACIVFLTALNCAGIRESATVQAGLTGLKLLLVLVLFISAMAYASRDPSIIITNLSYATAFQGTKGIFGFGSAMVSCLWSYDGYCDLNFLMEELQEPDKHLPQVVMSSLAIVTVAYVCANVAYFAVLSSGAIIASKSVAVDMGEKVGGLAVASFFAIGVVVSTAGSNNGSIMTGGRAFYAVGRGGHAPKFLSYLNRNNAPYMALLAQGSWTLFLLLIPGSNFSSLLDYFGPASWFFYALSSSALIVLRFKEPHTVRPYRTPFYPLPPLVVIGIACVIITSSFVKQPLYCGFAFGFVALSVPVHWALKRWDVFGPPNEEDTDTDIVIETNNNNYDNLSINDPINVHINNPISVHINDHINEKNSSDLGRR